MDFNEKVHAFIAAKFYVHLEERFKDRGIRAFVHGTQYYAEQRGRRMAQKAIRDGHELNYETYMAYGEWVNTETTINDGTANKRTVEALSPDYLIHITTCPWHAQFKDMGLVEAGHVYCEHLDNSIARGFNPYLIYEVEQTLHKADYCIHRIHDQNFAEMPNIPKKSEYVLDFSYHCGHSYWSYNEVVAAIFGAHGEQVNAQVLADFENEYGSDMADRLARYKFTNFNVAVL